MATYVQLSEEDPAVLFVDLVASILYPPPPKVEAKAPEPKPKQKEQPKKKKVESEEEDEEEKDEEEKDEEEKDEEDDEEDEEPKKSKVKAKAKQDSRKTRKESDDAQSKENDSKRKPSVKEEVGQPEEAKKKLAKLLPLAESGKLAQLIEEGCFSNIDKILKASDEEIQAVFDLCFSFLERILADSKEKKGEDQVVRIVKQMALFLTQEPAKKTETKLSLLVTLFNLLPETSPLRHYLFVSILQMALGTGTAALLADQLSSLEQWVGQWKLQPVDARKLYLLAADILQDANKSQDALEFKYKALRTVESLSDAEINKLDDVLTLAADAVTQELISSSIRPYDTILGLKAVGCLARSKQPQHKQLHRLLEIFTSEDAGAYLIFSSVKENKKFLQNIGINHEDTLKKIRSLTICSLGSKHERIKYSQLMEELKLETAEEVEACVIDAIISGRVDAKIDQDSEEILVERTTPRYFDRDSWQQIGTKLDAWHQSLHNVIDSLRHAQHRDEQQMEERHLARGAHADDEGDL